MCVNTWDPVNAGDKNKLEGMKRERTDVFSLLCL